MTGTQRDTARKAQRQHRALALVARPRPATTATAGRPRARRGCSSGCCRPPPPPNPGSRRLQPRRAERTPSLRPAEGGRRVALTLRAGADLRHRFLHRRHRRGALGGGTAALHLPPSSPPVGAPRREPGPGLRSAAGLRRRRHRACASLCSRRRSFPTAATLARLTRRPLRNLLTPPRFPPPPLPSVPHRRLPPPRGRPSHGSLRPSKQRRNESLRVPFSDECRGYGAHPPALLGEWNVPSLGPLPALGGGPVLPAGLGLGAEGKAVGLRIGS